MSIVFSNATKFRQQKDEGWLSGEKKMKACLFGGNWSLARLSEFLDHTGVTAEILLAPNENNRKARTEMHDLGIH